MPMVPPLPADRGPTVAPARPIATPDECYFAVDPNGTVRRLNQRRGAHDWQSENTEMPRVDEELSSLADDLDVSQTADDGSNPSDDPLWESAQVAEEYRLSHREEIQNDALQNVVDTLVQRHDLDCQHMRLEERLHWTQMIHRTLDDEFVQMLACRTRDRLQLGYFLQCLKARLTHRVDSMNAQLTELRRASAAPPPGPSVAGSSEASWSEPDSDYVPVHRYGEN